MAEGNFDFLSAHDELLLRLAHDAERYFQADPNTCVFKLRQLGEAIAQSLAVTFDLWNGAGEPPHQADLLRDLQRSGYVDRDVAQLFHVVRKGGNRAVHEFVGQHRQAVEVMKAARAAAVWFHRTMGRKPNFKPGAFNPPEDPGQRHRDLQAQIVELKMLADRQKHSVEEAESLAAAERERAEEAAQLVALYDTDRQQAEEIALESTLELEAYRQRLAASQGGPLSAEEKRAHRQAGAEAKHDLEVGHEHTLVLVDHDLLHAGWVADALHLRYDQGARPAADTNLAIAHWPTSGGVVDYMLFVGLVPLGVVKASHQSDDLVRCLDDAERHACGLLVRGNMTPAEPPGRREGFGGWDAGVDGFGHPRRYRVPFAFSTSGEDHHPEHHEVTGVWLRDLRLEEGADRLECWPSPEELAGRFAGG